MLLKFEEIECIGMNVKYTSFAVHDVDVKRILEGGICQPSGEEYTIIIVKSYEEESYTTSYKIRGDFDKILNSFNGYEIY